MKTKYLFFNIIILFISFSLSAQTGNVKLGDGTGNSITLGDYNVMVGDSAAFKLTSGKFSVFLGRRAGFNTTTSTDNIFIGSDAGYRNRTGTDNVFIGRRAGYSGETGSFSDNVFIGMLSGESNTSGDDNTFIGEESGLKNTTGDDNVFIGEDAGYNNTTASDNTFVGGSAGRSNTTGFRNTAIGAEAGYDLSGGSPNPSSVDARNYGSYNTFVGDSTGVDVGKGAFNTFVGQAAGAATEAGSRNTFMGFRAGYDNNRTNASNNANENTYFGFRTGLKNRTGSYNLMLGSRTDFTSNQNNLYNIGLGYNVRIGNGTTSKNYAIAIGNNAKVTANNAIAIGNGSKASLNNTMVLGGATNRVSVGIGTETPNIKASLDLADTDKGFLINRLTNAEKTTLATTLAVTDIGLLIYDTDDKKLFSWDGTAWAGVGSTDSSLETRIAALEASATGNTADKTPLLFNYQTALLNASDQPLANTTVSFRISILQTTATGTSVYQEAHSATTTSGGLTSFKIGNGTVVSGDFSAINWGTDSYFLKVEADVTGGTAYSDFGTSQFVTVPYAMHARTADRLTSGTSSKSATKNKEETESKTIDESESLRKEVAELKAIVKQLQNSIKNLKNDK